jgi:hypothetical protein
MQSFTHADFDALSFHDDSLYGLALRGPDVERGDWTSDLVLDIDHIVEWLREGDRFRFRVAPATLVFHGVTDLRVAFDQATGAFQIAPMPPPIHAIERERIAEQKVHLDRPYYAWRIPFNAPARGEIGFGAWGFTLTLRGEPLLVDAMQLSPSQRGELR